MSYSSNPPICHSLLSIEATITIYETCNPCIKPPCCPSAGTVKKMKARFRQELSALPEMQAKGLDLVRQLVTTSSGQQIATHMDSSKFCMQVKQALQNIIILLEAGGLMRAFQILMHS